MSTWRRSPITAPSNTSFEPNVQISWIRKTLTKVREEKQVLGGAAADRLEWDDQTLTESTHVVDEACVKWMAPFEDTKSNGATHELAVFVHRIVFKNVTPPSSGGWSPNVRGCVTHTDFSRSGIESAYVGSNLPARGLRSVLGTSRDVGRIKLAVCWAARSSYRCILIHIFFESLRGGFRLFPGFFFKRLYSARPCDDNVPWAVNVENNLILPSAPLVGTELPSNCCWTEETGVAAASTSGWKKRLLDASKGFTDLGLLCSNSSCCWSIRLFNLWLFNSLLSCRCNVSASTLVFSHFFSSSHRQILSPSSCLILDSSMAYFALSSVLLIWRSFSLSFDSILIRFDSIP